MPVNHLPSLGIAWHGIALLAALHDIGTALPSLPVCCLWYGACDVPLAQTRGCKFGAASLLWGRCVTSTRL